MSVARETPGYITVSFEYSRNIGPKCIQGGVTLSFEPAESYSFCSEAKWPSTDDYSDSVRRAVEAVLVRRNGSLPLVRATLAAIAWHAVDSCELGFYTAARIAAGAAFEA